jgi:hypothetical protein
LQKYLHIVKNTECECIQNNTHEELINKVKLEKQWQREEKGAYFVPCYTETMYIYSPHAYGYVTLNDLSIIHLNKGYNAFCLCGYNKVRGKCNETYRDCIVLTLQPGLFMRLVKYNSHNFRIAFFVLYNTFHACNKPPINQDPAPTLKHLSVISIMAAKNVHIISSFLKICE